MQLYLVRHGDALTKEADPKRPLSPTGRAEAQRIAAFAERIGVRVEEIRESGKLRARQTAEILAERLGPKDGIVTTEGIGPEDDVYSFARELAIETRPILVVGHLPFLARLTSQLVAGNPDRPLVLFRCAAMVHLEREGRRWTIEFAVDPDLIG